MHSSKQYLYSEWLLPSAKHLNDAHTFFFSDALLYTKVAKANSVYSLNSSTLMLNCKFKNHVKEKCIDLIAIQLICHMRI